MSKKNDMLYQICGVCDGTGKGGLLGGDEPCPVCEPMRVIPIGVTAGQLFQIHRDKTNFEKDLEKCPIETETTLLRQMSRGAVNCGQHSGCYLAKRYLDQREKETEKTA